MASNLMHSINRSVKNNSVNRQFDSVELLKLDRMDYIGSAGNRSDL